MSSAQGIANIRENQLIFRFQGGDAPSQFAAVLPEPLPVPSGTAQVSLNYQSRGELLGQHAFQGQIQEGNMNLVLDNGVRIVGRLQQPVPVSEHFQGTGQWINM